MNEHYGGSYLRSGVVVWSTIQRSSCQWLQKQHPQSLKRRSKRIGLTCLLDVVEPQWLCKTCSLLETDLSGNLKVSQDGLRSEYYASLTSSLHRIEQRISVNMLCG